MTRLQGVLLASMLMTPGADASIVREFYRAPEMMAMGNAGIAFVDGENAVFYNPAGLAGGEKMTVHAPKIDLVISRDTVTAKDSLEAIDDPSGSALSPFMGKNIYAQATGTAALVLPNLGLAAFFDGQGALSTVNQAFPKVEFGYQKTSGFQVAVGMSSVGVRHLEGRGNKPLLRQSEWRAGAAVKMVQRVGGYRVFPVAELLSYRSKEAIMSMMGDSGVGYGADLGVQRVQRLDERTSLHWGMAYTNIGDTSVGAGSDPARAILTSGIGAKFDLTLGELSLAYDIRHITREDDWRKKQHVGARFALPLLFDFYAGLNQTHLTYGAGVDLLLLKVNALSYAVETGSFVDQDPERRYQITLEMKFPL